MQGRRVAAVTFGYEGSGEGAMKGASTVRIKSPRDDGITVGSYDVLSTADVTDEIRVQP